MLVGRKYLNLFQPLWNYRLKLLSLIPDEPMSGTFYDGKFRNRIDEEKSILGETCRKFLSLKDYLIITNTLKEVTTGLQISLTYGPSKVIEFLETRVFKLRHEFLNCCLFLSIGSFRNVHSNMGEGELWNVNFIK